MSEAKREAIGTIVMVLYDDGEVQRFTGTSFAFIALEDVAGEHCQVAHKVVAENNVHRVLLYNLLKDTVAEMKNDATWLEDTREVFEATLAAAEGGVQQ